MSRSVFSRSPRRPRLWCGMALCAVATLMLGQQSSADTESSVRECLFIGKGSRAGFVSRSGGGRDASGVRVRGGMA